MSWTAEKTWLVGDVLTASDMNVYVRDNATALIGVTGIVAANGTITAGTGFSVVHSGTGVYAVTFSPVFPAAPVVLTTPVGTSRLSPDYSAGNPTATGFTLQLKDASNTLTDAIWNFNARFVA